MKDNILIEKSIIFAARIIKLNRYLIKNRLLSISEYISKEIGDSLLQDCLEIKRILVASINTAKENRKAK